MALLAPCRINLQVWNSSTCNTALLRHLPLCSSQTFPAATPVYITEPCIYNCCTRSDIEKKLQDSSHRELYPRTICCQGFFRQRNMPDNRNRLCGCSHMNMGQWNMFTLYSKQSDDKPHKSAFYKNGIVKIDLSWGRILGRNPEKSLTIFPPWYSESPLQLYIVISISSNSRNLFQFLSCVTVHCKGERRKPERKPHPKTTPLSMV